MGLVSSDFKDIALERRPPVGPQDPITREGLVIDLDSRHRSSLTMTGTRVDDWVDLASGIHFATSVSGVTRNPAFEKGLFRGLGGVRFTKSLGHYLESTRAVSEVNGNNYTAIGVLVKYDNNWNGALCDKGNTLRLLGWGSNLRMGGEGDFSIYGVPKGVPFVYGVRVQSGVTTAVMNTEPLRSMFSGSGFAQSYPLTTLQLGARGGLSNPGDMAIGALKLYNRGLSDSALLNAMKWLTIRWNISTPIDSLNIVIDGNSLIVGSTNKLTPPVCELASHLSIHPSSVAMNAYVGRTTEDIVDRAPTITDPLLIPGRKNVAILYEATNSLIAGGADRLEVLDLVESWCLARRAHGFKVVVGTPPPRKLFAGNNQNFEDDRLWLIEQLEASWNQFADGFANAGADAVLGATGANTNTTYFDNDQTHLRDAGSAIVARYLSNGVREALL